MTTSKQTPNQTIYEIIVNHKKMTIPETVRAVNEYIESINKTEQEVFGRARTPKITDDEVRKARLWRR